MGDAAVREQGRPVVVCGCGYSGRAIAEHWPGPVWGTTRSEERAADLESAGIRAVQAAFAAGEPLPTLPESVAGGAAVLTMGPDRSPDVRDPHAALAEALDWLIRQGITDVVYLSSTSVYGRSRGGEVTAATPVNPEDEMGLRRVEAETLVRDRLQGRSRLSTLRLPGIYGPGRTIRQRLEAGRYRLVEGGTMFSNRIFVDDIATAVLRLLDEDVRGGIWIACDDEPFQVRDMVRFACDHLGCPMPPEVPLSSVPERIRPFWQGNRRCNADRLKALGWAPRWPSYREGLPEAWRREDEEQPPAEGER